MTEATLPVATTNGTAERQEPLGFFEDLEREMERFFRTPVVFRGSFVWPFHNWIGSRGPWAPRMDVFEKDGSIVVKAELPGLKKEDVTVEIEGDDLVIRGEFKAETEVKEADYSRMERSAGSFYRRMPLPEGITPEQIEATLADGILEVRIPKPVEAKTEATRIEVK
jgi:HSP20 family protein